MKKWLLDYMSSPVKKAMPILSFPGVQLCGCTVGELVRSAEKQAECMAAVARRVNSAAGVSLMDLSVEAECFGSQIAFSDNEVPTVTGVLLSNEEQAHALAVPEVGAGRSGVYIKAISLAKEKITDRPVFAGAIGPFSLTGRLVGVTEAMYYCYDEPDMLHTVLEKASDFIVKYITAFRDAGADGVVLAEPLSGLLSPALEEEFSAPYVKKIAEAVRTDSFIVIYHNCGAGTVNMLESIFSNGCDAYHFGNAVDLEDILKGAPAGIPVMGNIDPAGQFNSGTPEAISAATNELLEGCSKYPGFIISSGCDIPPQASWGNIDAFFKTVDNFYERRIHDVTA